MERKAFPLRIFSTVFTLVLFALWSRDIPVRLRAAFWMGRPSWVNLARRGRKPKVR